MEVFFKEMLRLVYDTGGKLHIMNKQNLTPLTLAAKLAKKKVGFFFYFAV